MYSCIRKSDVMNVTVFARVVLFLWRRVCVCLEWRLGAKDSGQWIHCIAVDSGRGLLVKYIMCCISKYTETYSMWIGLFRVTQSLNF